MQTKADKQKLVEATAEAARAAKAIVFADFKGLPVKEMTALKRELRQSGATMKVLKKTLLNLALRDAGIPVDGRKLEGQVATVFSSDEVSAAKVMVAFAKKDEHLKVVAGSLGNKALSVAEVKALSALPTLDELRGQLVGTLQAPITGFVRTLSGNLSGLVRVLSAVADSKKA